MDSYLIGELAAITGSLFWSFCTIFFAFSSKRVGAHNVNGIRILMAMGLLTITHLVIYGTIIPHANRLQWFYLGLSGFIGLALGDLMYFGSLVILGPRKGVLIMATNPIFSAIAGYFILDEILNVYAIIGISITLCGVSWVILERDIEKENGGANKKLDDRKKICGVLLGIGGAIGQGVGLVISKYGMENVADDKMAPLSPLSATFIRVFIAGISFVFILLLMNKFSNMLKSFNDRKATVAIFGGALLGPFLGVFLSMVAVTYTQTGIASTLLSLMPVMIIPIVWVLYKQKTSWRGFIGAILTILGVAILFLMGILTK